MHPLTVFNSLILVGLIAGVITNGVLYGQTRSGISTLTNNLNNATNDDFVILLSSANPDRFSGLENVNAAFWGFTSTIISYSNYSVVTLSTGGAIVYTNATLGYAKFVTSNVFPNGYPYLNQPSPILGPSVAVDGSTGNTFAGNFQLSVLSNGYDVMVNAMIPTNGPPGDGDDIYIMPISIVSYVVPK